MLPKINFSQYGICSNMVANSLPEDIPSALVRALLLGLFNDQNLVLLVQEGLSVSSVGMCMKYC